MNPRFYTNKLYQMIEDYVISEEQVVSMCLNYMSEDDVKDMMESNDLTEELNITQEWKDEV